MVGRRCTTASRVDADGKGGLSFLIRAITVSDNSSVTIVGLSFSRVRRLCVSRVARSFPIASVSGVAAQFSDTD